MSGMFRHWLLSAVLVWLLLLPTSSGRAGAGSPSLRFTWCALDQGDATLIEAPGGKTALVGAGAPSEGAQLLRFLKQRGIHRLDYLMITTWSQAQTGGAPVLFRGIPVGQVFHNPLYIRGKANDDFYFEAQKRKGREGVRAPTPGETMTLFYTPPCRMRAVAPTGPMLTRFDGDPRCSMVTQWIFDRFSLLDLGHTTQKHQQAFWSQADPRPDGKVLVIGRGGADALLPSLLKPLNTRIAVLPIPRKGPKPAAALLATLKQAGVRLYRTDRQGTLSLTTDGQNMQVKTGG